MKLETLGSCNLCDSSQIDTIDPECNICRCRSCGYIFPNPRPTLDELISFYSQPTKYDTWLSEEETRDALWRRRLKKMHRTRKPGNLLDVGTGTGQFLRHAKPYYTEVCGTEVSESAIEVARTKYNLNVAKGVIEEIEFGTTFDNISLFHVLEHVPNPRATIERCHSLLNSGGILVIAVPNDVLSLRRYVRLFFRKIGVKRFQDVGAFGMRKIALDGSMNEIHLSLFTPEVLARFLERQGFSVIEQSLDPAYVTSGAKRLLDDAYFLCHSLLRYALKMNHYDTIWTVAEKRTE